MIKNTVIAACAGSGKTYALVSRLLALLRAGAKPAEILAITFTYKAAAEIRERLLLALHAHAATEPLLGEWRRRILLAAHPDDVFHVHTFHSWFMVLMHGAPWRAGRITPPRLRHEQNELFERAWRQWQKQAESRPSAELKAVLAELSPHSLHQMLQDLYANRNAFWLYRQQESAPAEAPPTEHALQMLRDAAAQYAQVAQAHTDAQQKHSWPLGKWHLQIRKTDGRHCK